MVDAALGRARLVAQGLVGRPFPTPLDAVAAHGAMQGQDLPGAIASAALRTASGDVGAVLAELDAGRLVRGYPMRGTVFLMAADDVAWVSQLCNAGALRAAEKRRAQLGLTDAMVDQARDVALAALEESPRGLSRAALFARWGAVGIPTAGGPGYHVLAHLVGRVELVYGPWNGTDQDVVAASTWLPAGTSLAERFDGERVPAVAELLLRYLTSHGPATLRDFAWWTKLGLTEIRRALPLVRDQLEEAPWPEHWQRPGLADEVAAAGRRASAPLLLPGFDEFVLGYADRLFAMTPEEHALVVPGNNGVFGKTLVAGGLVRGTWKRGGTAGRRRLDAAPFAEPSAAVAKGWQARWADFPFPTP